MVRTNYKVLTIIRGLENVEKHLDTQWAANVITTGAILDLYDCKTGILSIRT